MKIVTLTFIASALLFAQEKKPISQSKPPAAATLPGIPADAKEIEPGLYRYTDRDGKTWLMRKTPFGVGKWEDKPDAQPAVVQSNVPVTIKDLGDSIQFTRDSPFGPSKWTRKKTELTDEEKAIVKREQSKQSNAASTVDSKPQPEKREKQ